MPRKRRERTNRAFRKIRPGRSESVSSDVQAKAGKKRKSCPLHLHPGRGLHPTRFLENVEEARMQSRIGEQDYPPCPPPFFRYPSFRERSRSPICPAYVGSQPDNDHPDLYPCQPQAAAQDVSKISSSCLNRMDKQTMKCMSVHSGSEPLR